MKVRLMSLLHMKYTLFFLIGPLLIHGSVFSNTMVMQFRTPLSLAERLHEGLLEVQEDIQKAYMLDSDQARRMLKDCWNRIEALQDLYNFNNSKSGLNEIHADERDFLQNLIDRIDQMIQALEGGSSDSDDSIKKNMYRLHELRAALEY